MIITNPILGGLFLILNIFYVILIVRVWMEIANFVGNKLGLVRFIIGLIERKKDK